MALSTRALLLLFAAWAVAARDYDDEPAEPPAADACNGIFLTYMFESREKAYPHVKNASAQAYAFKSTTTVLNTGRHELKGWKIFVGFQHDEILVSTNGAVVMDGEDYPVRVGKNGTHLSGFPMTDLKTSIETAGDMNQIRATIDFVGTQFGVKPPKIPMPKTIKLANDGYKCPKPRRHANLMYVCCVRDPKHKAKKTRTKFLRRRDGDLTMTYDVMQAYEGNYQAQVTISNNNPLGRLDNWNLTWEWMRGEFINTMKGAYTFTHDPSACLYSAAGNFYRDFDFHPVMSCEKKPIITDLPPERANDTRVGKIPYCCKNGTLLPPYMDPSKSIAIFQLQVFKIPPDMNRTTLYPPQHWRIKGHLNPDYKCAPPIRVSPTVFPDTSGLMSRSYAVASWQVACNITHPKAKKTRCCVSYSAFYNDSVVPCNTCACGCDSHAGHHHHHKHCNAKAPPLLLPPEALLVPFDNRTAKAKAWARIKHFHVPKHLPCGDNCGVSINWHLYSDYRTGWTARITIFNWEDYTFKDWFAAVQLKKKVLEGYEKIYSFNGTVLPEHDNDTLFFQGLPGLNYLMPEVDGKNPETDPRVPGKQQSVVSFTKKLDPGFDIIKGDGFPARVLFNGEECALPHSKPKVSGTTRSVELRGVAMIMVLVAGLTVGFGLLGVLW